MSGSLLGRGRGGRLVVYGGCPVLIFILVFLYHAATSEMDRLRELQEQCVHQQEALAAQLQVIFEYKVRLEKSLAEEKSSNAAIKQELQQRATREKSLRDKDSIEAMQRFNSLQQTYKILQSEHEDLKEECKKREKLALDETTRLETTLQDLRSQLRQLQKDKEKTMENLKNNYMTLLVDHEKLEKKYNVSAKSNSDNEMTILHLKKEVFQLQREIKELRDGKSNFSKSTPSSEAVLKVSPLSSRKPDLPPIPAPQHQQQDLARDLVSSRKAENITVASNANSLVSPSVADKVVPPPIKPLKVKLPVGVLPIPEMIEQQINNADDEKHQEEVRKRDDAAHNNVPPPPRFAPAKNNKEEKEPIVEAGNLDPPFVANPAPMRPLGEQIERRANDGGWFRVRPGVQEVGEELNQLGRLPGLDDGQANGADDQYDVADYDKEPQQKNDIHLAEGEDEGEDDDMLDYPHNLKQEKRE
ncbi:Golgi integral membrane protein 4-like [Pseudomyrmex gracilis]|uniref:Golgi integral membrane protein 4-like n=1 Tax=Pseudomyrmex gracilis TaxID=219809 RepID=UPI00099593CB|nr:Golgi integral membrane protein 4-like [Pseudomyrmex gracilis]